MSQFISGPGVFIDIKSSGAALVNSELSSVESKISGVGTKAVTTVDQLGIGVNELIGKITLLTGAAVSFYTIGAKISEVLYPSAGAKSIFDVGNVQDGRKELERINKELAEIATKIAEGESPDFVNSTAFIAAGNNLKDLYTKRDVLEQQAQRTREAIENEEAVKRKESDKQLADERAAQEKALASKRRDESLAALSAESPLLSERDKIIRAGIIERARLNRRLDDENDGEVRKSIQTQIDYSYRAQQEALEKLDAERAKSAQERAKKEVDAFLDAYEKGERQKQEIAQRYSQASADVNSRLIRALEDNTTGAAAFTESIRSLQITSTPGSLW